MSIQLADAPTSEGQTRAIFLPIVTTVEGPSPVAEFERLLITDPRQQRTLTYSHALNVAAARRAEGLANGGDPWGHVDAAGRTPNEYARQACCRLPVYYAVQGNNVESLVAGTADAGVAFAALAASPKHAEHLFGLGWFGHQQHFGLAMAAGGEYGWYWVIMIGLCQ